MKKLKRYVKQTEKLHRNQHKYKLNLKGDYNMKYADYKKEDLVFVTKKNWTKKEMKP